MFDFFKKKKAAETLQNEKCFAFAAKAIIRKGDEFLVLTRSDSEKNTGDIYPSGADLPGGKIEFGEKPEEGLLREVMEESSLEIDIVRPLRTWSFMKSENTQLVGVTYLAEYKSGEVKLSWEHSAFKWVKLAEILEGDYPAWFKKDFGLI